MRRSGHGNSPEKVDPTTTSIRADGSTSATGSSFFTRLLFFQATFLSGLRVQIFGMECNRVVDTLRAAAVNMTFLVHLSWCIGHRGVCCCASCLCANQWLDEHKQSSAAAGQRSRC